MAEQVKNAKAYPLAWPKSRPRTKIRKHPRFADRSIATAFALLKGELSRMGAAAIVVSTNIPLKPNGEPYSEKTKLLDPGVAVYFRLKDKPYCLPCDKWELVEDNMHAVGKHIEAMRGMERWGVGSIEQTFEGFKMLTAVAGASEDWRTVLGLGDNATVDQIKKAHLLAAQAAHPDRGGSSDQMARLNMARDRALAEVGRG